jgi:Flp pilus assembly pilin Flp
MTGEEQMDQNHQKRSGSDAHPRLSKLRAFVSRLAADESGAEILEYVLIAGLIIVGTIAVVASFGTKVMARWTSVNSSM